MSTDTLEDLDSYRQRARKWLAANMPPLPTLSGPWMMVEEDGVEARQLQRRLFDGGFAGICFPKEYGGQGLPRQYQAVFTEESAPYQMPFVFNVPTLSILAPTILDFGTEKQKLRHLPALLSGEELWVQFLSEPTGGSDLAGLITRATRDGDVFLLNGSKIWSSGAYRADYALCLTRTNWQVPKHRGLTMFIVKIHQPGIEVQQIKMVNGVNEFCQEFFDNVAIPSEDVMGQVDDGWTVASRLLFHERDAVGGGSPYISGVGPGSRMAPKDDLIELAKATGQAKDGRVRQLVAESRADQVVQRQLVDRVVKGMAGGQYPGPAGSLLRLWAGATSERQTDIGLEVAGALGGAWLGHDNGGVYGQRFLFRQGGSLGGGSNEMQRNIISERLLGMPREFAADRDKPFDEVRHNTAPARR
jgi:alkylation response protein AidB-like acyl-CoA dehydrogenase